MKQKKIAEPLAARDSLRTGVPYTDDHDPDKSLAYISRRVRPLAL